jgi:hypothetical protein
MIFSCCAKKIAPKRLTFFFMPGAPDSYRDPWLLMFDPYGVCPVIILLPACRQADLTAGRRVWLTC